MNKQYNSISNSALDAMKSLVNAVIPRTTELAYLYGAVQYYGALDLLVDEYVIYTLNYFEIPLAEPTAQMLDTVTGSFIELDQTDQLYALTVLSRIQINLSYLPLPFQDNAQLVISVAGSLVSYTMMGYYSEWNGYGSTRLADPNQRVLEYDPLSWMQIGYPGPSLGYRALRVFKFT